MEELIDKPQFIAAPMMTHTKKNFTTYECSVSLCERWVCFSRVGLLVFPHFFLK